jgi:hypothetical protein
MELMKEASTLNIRITRNGVEKVRLTFPAIAARFLLELIPADALERIRQTTPALEAELKNLGSEERLQPRDLFNLQEPERQIQVWLA